MEFNYNEQGELVGPDGNAVDVDRLNRLVDNLYNEKDDVKTKLKEYQDGGSPEVERLQAQAEESRQEYERLRAENQRRDIRDDAVQANAVDPDSVSRVLDAELWKVDRDAAFNQLRQDHPSLFAADPAQGIPAKDAAKGTNSGGLLGNLFKR